MNDEVARLFDLTGQVAVLTGAGSGVGRATALTLAAAGCELVLADIDEGRLEETARLLGEGRERPVLVRADVGQRADVEGLIDRAVQRFGRVDILGNIAGIRQSIPIVDMTDEDLERILAINLKSVFYGCRAALRVMIPQKSGCIVNISSTVIDSSAATWAGYGMAKAAVAMLTKTAASEGGPHGVRVNAIAPGALDTNFRLRGQTPEEQAAINARWVESNPMKVDGKPEFIAHAFLYLCAPAASWVTGQILRPNGGSSMPW
jgi:3-oxoacyl-[acyl-carrier protein] reductase